jgi:hypothetical protein
MSGKFFGSLGIDGWITDREIIQCTMLVGGTGVVRHLHDPVEELFCRWSKFLSGNVFRTRDGFDKGFPIERVDLVESHNRNHQPVAQFRRSNCPFCSDYYVHVHWARRGTKGFDQEIEVHGITHLQDVGFQPPTVYPLLSMTRCADQASSKGGTIPTRLGLRVPRTANSNSAALAAGNSDDSKAKAPVTKGAATIRERFLHPLVLHIDVPRIRQPGIGLRNYRYDQRLSKTLEVQLT